jgi:O-antigen/teichoic acid export membrane protein
MISRLHRNFGLLLASNVLSPIFSMALVLAISRVQGVEMLGKYSLMMTVFVLGQSCATLGLPVLITRDVARARETAGRYFVTASVVTTGLLLPLVVLAVPALHWLVADTELTRALGYVLVALLPSVLTLYGEAVLLAFERAVDFVAVGLAENVLRATVGAALVLTGHGIAALALSLLGLRLFAAAVLLGVLRLRGIDLRAGVDRRLGRALVSSMPVVGSIPLVNALYARADIFMLTWLGTWAEVGLYSAAARLVDVARTVAPAYSRALYPVLSRLQGTSLDEFAKVARRSLRDLLLVVVPIALVLSGLAYPLITLLYGSDLAPAAGSLRVLAWTLVPVAAAGTLAQMLFSAKKQGVDLSVNVIATVVAVALNALLIPRWGALGAAVTALFSACLYATVQYLWVRSAVADPSAHAYVGKLVAVGLGSCALMALVSGTGAILTGALGLTMYVAGVALTGVLTRQDFHRVRLYLGWATSGSR